ncbi:hypothetical protein [Streptomyces spiramyceticus]|nr:hypothetical protein [Streptomyces spiramyceticus]
MGNCLTTKETPSAEIVMRCAAAISVVAAAALMDRADGGLGWAVYGIG